MHINWPLAVVSALSAATLFLHVFGGSPEYLEIIRASALPAGQTSMYAVLWHAVTANLLIAAGAFGVASVRPSWRSAAILVIAEFVAFAALFVWYGLTELGSLWPMPQWILFSVFAAIATFGLLQTGTKTPLPQTAHTT